MTATLVGAALAALCVAVVLRPFASTRGHARTLAEADPDSERGTELLRQLRDLDEDLASGKLSADDHRRLRGPVESQAARTLRRVGATEVSTPTAVLSEPRPHRRRTAFLALGAGAVCAGGVWMLLSGSLAPRGIDATVAGDTAPGSPSQSAAADAVPGPGVTAPSRPGQLTGVEAAVARVRTSPKDVSAHLDLARLYAAAGNPQLSAIEYLAVTQLDPANAGANTQLALVAFQAGQPAQAKSLVDAALKAHPRYPEGLYARGLIQLMGLRQPVAAERDLRAYLATAPRGSHRASVETLLAIASGPAR